MIDHVQIQSGYAADLPALAGRRLEFTPGINILYGPNGCGKSTLLRVMAGYCGVGRGGWSIHPTSELWDDGDALPPMPHAMALKARGCRADVGWDGSPTFLYHTEAPLGGGSSTVFESESDSPDGMTGAADQLLELTEGMSQGQHRIGKLFQMVDLLKSRPDLTVLPERLTKANDRWRRPAQAFVDHVNSLPRSGPATLLMDEPEKSMSAFNEARVYGELIRSLDQGYQVIVVTHSVLALLMLPEANVIDLVDGSVGQIKELYRRAVADPIEARRWLKKFKEIKAALPPDRDAPTSR